MLTIWSYSEVAMVHIFPDYFEVDLVRVKSAMCPAYMVCCLPHVSSG